MRQGLGLRLSSRLEEELLTEVLHHRGRVVEVAQASLLLLCKGAMGWEPLLSRRGTRQAALLFEIIHQPENINHVLLGHRRPQPHRLLQRDTRTGGVAVLRRICALSSRRTCSA